MVLKYLLNRYRLDLVPPSINFQEAARRHFYDAELLLVHHGRTAGAGQLYGFAAECGIKSLLVWQGYPTDAVTGDIRKGQTLRAHIHQIAANINLLQTHLQGRGATRYLALMPSIGNFSDWTTDHRYFAASELPPSAAAWRSAAGEVLKMLDQTRLDGAPQ